MKIVDLNAVLSNPNIQIRWFVAVYVMLCYLLLLSCQNLYTWFIIRHFFKSQKSDSYNNIWVSHSKALITRSSFPCIWTTMQHFIFILQLSKLVRTKCMKRILWHLLSFGQCLPCFHLILISLGFSSAWVLAGNNSGKCSAPSWFLHIYSDQK